MITVGNHLEAINVYLQSGVTSEIAAALFKCRYVFPEIFAKYRDLTESIYSEYLDIHIRMQEFVVNFAEKKQKPGIELFSELLENYAIDWIKKYKSDISIACAFMNFFPFEFKDELILKIVQVAFGPSDLKEPIDDIFAYYLRFNLLTYLVESNRTDPEILSPILFPTDPSDYENQLHLTLTLYKNIEYWDKLLNYFKTSGPYLSSPEHLKLLVLFRYAKDENNLIKAYRILRKTLDVDQHAILSSIRTLSPWLSFEYTPEWHKLHFRLRKNNKSYSFDGLFATYMVASGNYDKIKHADPYSALLLNFADTVNSYGLNNIFDYDSIQNLTEQNCEKLLADLGLNIVH